MKTTKEIDEEITRLKNEKVIATKREAEDFVNANRGKWFERSGSFFKILGLSEEYFVNVLQIKPVWQGIEIVQPRGHFDIQDLKPVKSDFYDLENIEKQLEKVLSEFRG